MDNASEIFCPSCHTAVPSTANFCLRCGEKLKETPPSTSVTRQIIIYLVSFFLAPFGLGFAIKYVTQPGAKARTIGIVSLILTIIAIALMFLAVKTFYGFVYGSFDTLTF